MDPRAAYESRLARWRAAGAAEARRFVLLGNLRLAAAVLAGMLAWLAFGKGWISAWSLVAPGAAFVAMVVIHERVARRGELARRGVRFYERGLARLDGSWPGSGSAGERFRDAAHPYAEDLDLFGRGSLFELLSTARTGAGERTLAAWLTAPAAADEVRARQEAVRELRGRLDLREDLALLGEDVAAGVHEAELAAWGARPPIPFPRYAPAAALALGAAALGGLLAWLAQAPGGGMVLLGASVCAAAFGFALRRVTLAVEGALDTPAHDLRILFLLLARFERENFSSPLLVGLRAQLAAQDGRTPSAEMRRLFRLIGALEQSDHLLLRIIGPAILYREQLAMAIERWRARSGPAIARWLDAIGQLEALAAFAAFAGEHPELPFPELTGARVFAARGLRHPLLGARAVPNDVALGGERPLLVVSGSNMSGKSTLLRAAGLNAVLAWAGAPVCAGSLTLGPFAVGASLRNVDSVQEGKSRFYAEISRLRQIMDLTRGPRPVLFLLDELLSGTNSHDRRIGAEAVIRGLLARGAAGMVTTHDLALTAIAPAEANVHFADELVNGEIRFDYKLKPGVVQRSNALELMRSVGLEVPE
jgi:hypothetical protein